MPPEGLLAIRSDIAEKVEREYLDWLTKEHTIERVGIEGFLSARIFRSQHSGFGRYLILYELAKASVVDSPAYLERLNNPTPWTKRMMPHLGNFVRGGGTVVTKWGAGQGAAIVPIMIGAEIPADAWQGLFAVSQEPGVVAIRVLETDTNRTAVATNERKLRSGDQRFDTLLMIEAFDEEAAKQAIKNLPPELLNASTREADSTGISVYSQIFNLNG